MSTTIVITVSIEGNVDPVKLGEVIQDHLADSGFRASKALSLEQITDLGWAAIDERIHKTVLMEALWRITPKNRRAAGREDPSERADSLHTLLPYTKMWEFSDGDYDNMRFVWDDLVRTASNLLQNGGIQKGMEDAEEWIRKFVKEE